MELAFRRLFACLAGAWLLLCPLSIGATDDGVSDVRALSPDEVLAERNQRVLDGDHLVALKPVQNGERLRFIPVWKKNPQHLGQRIRFDLALHAFDQAIRRYQHQGYGLLWSQQYREANSVKVAAIWQEQESAKVLFKHRISIERAITDYRSTITGGLVVAASHRGELVFSRGFGEHNALPVYADTEFPLLAASQAIAGVLAARLEQEQHTAAGVPINLSLDWAVADLLPLMPGSAAYTARHVLAHTACIDNRYIDSNIDAVSPSGSVSFQLASQVWNRAPIAGCIPGYLQFYSQPAYLLLAAFLEAATGQTVDTLLDREINQRFGVASIKASLPANGNVLGLGLQANALDLLKLLNGILKGTVLSDHTARTRLWNPVSEHSEFGLGWRLDAKGYAEARDDAAASSVRVWVDRRHRSVIVIFASQSQREQLDTLLNHIQRLL